MNLPIIGLIRVVTRLCALGAVILFSAADYCASNCFRLGDDSGRFRAAWLQRSTRKFLRVLNIRVTTSGMPPRRGMLVSNHLGYLDIAVFGSIAPMIFVSKKEVRDWPVFGWLSRCAGTLFVNRNNRADTKRVTGEMARTLNKGVVVGLFPEGTSSDGASVLPFRAPLLEPAVSQGWPVTPAAISYQVTGGSVENEVCYWGDMDFLTHLMNLLSKEAVFARVAFGTPVETHGDRKALALSLRSEVVQLIRSFAPAKATGEAFADLAR